MAGYGLDRFDRDVTVFHIQSFDSRLDLFNQLTAVSNNALAPVPPEERGQLRARILKLCLLTMANKA